MLLSDIFEDLHFGELSQLNLGGPDSGGIPEEYYPRIISFINYGLIELYKKFDLRVSEVVIDLDEGISEYLLTYDYAQSNLTSLEPVKYIADSVDRPFPDDILQITEVWREDGKELPINDSNEDDSVYTPEWNILQVPEPVNGTSLSLIYRTYPTEISKLTTDLPSVSLTLPPQLLTALYSYVAYRANLGMPEGEASKASASFSRFRGICQNITDLGLLNKPGTSNNKLDENGFA